MIFYVACFWIGLKRYSPLWLIPILAVGLSSGYARLLTVEDGRREAGMIPMTQQDFAASLFVGALVCAVFYTIGLVTRWVTSRKSRASPSANPRSMG